MGWAKENLTQDEREAIIHELVEFEANETIDAQGWITGKCPLHDDTRASFSYSVVDDVFRCHAQCNDDGDIAALWCLLHGYARNDSEGFTKFIKKYAAGKRKAGANARKTPGQIAKKKKAESVSVLPIPEDVFDQFGKIPPAMLAQLKIRRGWTEYAVERLEVRLLSHFRKRSNPLEVFPLNGLDKYDRVVFPVRDNDGVIRNLRIYYPFGLPPELQEKGQKIMSWAKGYGKARFFPALSTLPANVPIILVEGEPDCVCAHSFGIATATTQTSKTSALSDAEVAFFKNRDVVIAYDADTAGQKYAHNTASFLHKNGVNVSILEWPDYMGKIDGAWPDDHGQDLTDFFVKHHKDEHVFWSLVNNAKPFGVAPLPGPQVADGDDLSYMQFFASGVNGRVSFKERLLADWLMQTYPMLYHDRSGQLFKWDGSFYDVWSDEQLKSMAYVAMGGEAKTSWVGGSVSMAMSLTSMPQGRDINDMPEWVCLQNGMLNVYTLEFREHARDFMATIKLGVKWHFAGLEKGSKELLEAMERIRPARWLKFLSETIQTEGAIEQAQEYTGYCLTRETRFGKSLLMLGPGSDGKSVFLKILRALVGPQNCSAVSMPGLDDQFQRAGLFGKMVNITTEMPTNAMQSDMFKAIVTGDPVQASFKHKDSFEFIPFAKLVFSTNKLPRIQDNSDGYFRRLLPIQFKQQFLETDERMDPDLEDKLRDNELDGIFVWALQGLHRLMAQKRFTMTDETRNFMMRYRRYNNPVLGFVQDRCDVGEQETHKVQLKELYKEYKKYCTEGGYNPLNRENFYEEMVTAVRKIQEDIIIRRGRPREGDTRPEYVYGVDLNYGVDMDAGNSEGV